ncbi:hypothetical protein HELRODRAFT_109431 [Helobdella robusta]|uniref:MYND-type domain-containing protein n=1 Tax=Helobdella robusta TaxID=6412 RepID=T1EET8_HELRO|nr:hypothetical protein HELRODRAFT_109431 [Helobdella robusta]ESO10085.1 hypothetical protein HELRODRAFT_109431 [Helobdella robusta]
MNQAICKRKSDPRILQKLWTVINNIRLQKQVANVERIVRSMVREYDIKSSEVEDQLQFGVEDELIVAYKAVSQKGSNAGLEQDGFRISSFEEVNEQEKPDHDWYCYDCHKGGEVLDCSECWRVYHEGCIHEELGDEPFVCSICKDVKKQTRMKRKELNKLLTFTVVRLKDKSKELHFFCGADQGLNRFVFFYMDLNMMQEKANNRKYKYLEQFYADALTILHNIFICYGDNGILPHLARVMIRDCKYDLDEIRQCKDCYFHSNAKPKDWFCQPCRPRHELVFAKQKGFSYWPAKVIKILPEGYDVRFFGSQHQRAVIPENNIKPIGTNQKSLALKRTMGFTKAMKELSRHQELLEQMGDQDEADDQSNGENDVDDDQDKDEPIEKMPKVHHKKFHKKRHSEQTSVSSSLKSNNRCSSLGQFEDNHMVTSSEDKVNTDHNTSNASLRSYKKLALGVRLPTKSTQTEASNFDFLDISSLLPNEPSSVACTGEPGKCECEVKNNRLMRELVEKLERKHQQDKKDALDELEKRLWKESSEEQQKALNRAMTSQQREIDRIQNQMEKLKEEHAEELKQLSIKHKKEISLAKKKQWCYHCEEEAMYHCCWNTSYCSIKCQQDHWHTEHKRMCRRKRN